MPSRKTRINLTVEDDMNQLFQELSDLTGVPKARLIMDFLVEAKPAFLAMKRGLKMVKSSREKLPSVMLDLIAQANEQTAVMNKEMSDILSKQMDWVEKDD